MHRKLSGMGKNRTQQKERKMNKRGTAKSVYNSKHIRQKENLLAKPNKSEKRGKKI